MHMARTVIDIDQDALVVAQQVLGTRTMQDTVNAALRRVAAEARIAEEYVWWSTDPLPDLRDGDVMADAWR
jgi:Arc/MetJ family transcription regulator